jgi:hypothetical protein
MLLGRFADNYSAVAVGRAARFVSEQQASKGIMARDCNVD